MNTNKSIYNEGGNMFPDCVPIHQENVAATWDDVTTRFIEEFLKLDPETDISSLGSTGKKLRGGTSNDMDIAIDFHKLQEVWGLSDWDGRTRLPEWVDLAQEGADKCGVQFNKAGTVCSLRWPIVNDDGEQEGEFIQVDLMPTLNMKMTSFGRFSQQEREGETFFKGTVRNIMLSIMARCSYHKDLTEDTHTKTLEDGTEKEVHNEYEGWTYDGNSGLHLCHKKYEQYSRNGKGFQKGDWKPHATVVASPVISDDPDEIVEMIFGKGVTVDDVDTVQKMWRAWKNSPAVKENPDLIDEVRKQVEANANKNAEITFPDFDGEEFVNEGSESNEMELNSDLTNDDIESIMVSTKIENPRFEPDQFRKYYSDQIQWEVLFSGNQPVAIAAIKRNEPFSGYAYIDEVQNLKKGFGKPLLDKVFSKYGKVWLMANTAAGDSLVEYYRGLGLEEIDIEDSVWECPAYFFCTKECDYDKLEDYCVAYYANGSDDEDEEQFDEARAKTTPEDKVNMHLSSLTPEMNDKLKVRCVELLDKWDIEDEGDPIKQVWDYMGSEKFASMLRKVVPLKELALRDMGANTFVSKFFDIPFDAEAYLGKVAKEQGIPYTQAEQEWTRSNLDKTHVGRYAHMLANDAVNGLPPSKEGENLKEIAVYTAIYDYAKKLVENASDVESEVSLHAKDVNVGGKFDLMYKDGGEWVLVDWKTNGEDLDDIPTGKFGLEDVTKNINNNSYNKYALQLNVYEWAAKNGGKIPMNAKVRKELHHFQYDEGENIVNIKVISIPDMQELVQKMIDRGLELGIVKGKQPEV